RNSAFPCLMRHPQCFITHTRQCRRKWPARNLSAQHRGNLALEQLESGTVLCPGQAVAIGVYMEHLVPHLLVVSQHLVDDLLWAADQGRPAPEGALDRKERRLHPPPAHRRKPGLEDRAVRRDRLL